MDKHLLDYLNHHILTKYALCDAAHQIDHVHQVIHDSLTIAKENRVDLDMVYVIACFHDLGLLIDRKTHHLVGGKMLEDDQTVQQYFTKSQIQTMKEAIEDHRASHSEMPRSIYGKIIAEADRDLNLVSVCSRTIKFGLKNEPNLSKEDHIERAISHLQEKYGPSGYLKLWLHTDKNIKGLKEIHLILESHENLVSFLSGLYDEIICM